MRNPALDDARPATPRAARLAILLFGVACYAAFLASFLYLLAFLIDAPRLLAAAAPWLADWVPVTVDARADGMPPTLAVLIDLGLVAMFAAQHSVMARSGFKAWLTRTVPPTAERSVYVLASSLALTALCLLWQPLPMVVWQAETAIGSALGLGGFAAGVGLVLVATFLIDHFDLFGLKQVWRGFVGRALPRTPFVTPWLYTLVRHPLYVGWIVTFFATPVMTAGHLLFAAAMSAYILAAIPLEERDLEALHGDDYRLYKLRVPKLMPWPRRAPITG